jgi:hypothetical protein
MSHVVQAPVAEAVVPREELLQQALVAYFHERQGIGG